MNSGIPRSRLLAGSAVTALTILLTLTSGVLATGYQVRQSVGQGIAESAGKAVDRVDQILQEAENAAVQARPYLPAQHCLPETQNALNRLAIVRPHLRVISLLHQEELICSSFGGAKPHHIDMRAYAAGRLSIHFGSTVSPDTPILVLLTRFPEGTVASSIDIAHISEILSLLGNNTPLRLRVGGQILFPHGLVKNVPASGASSVNSAKYPYQIDYNRPGGLDLGMLVHQGAYLLAVFAALAILAGTTVWKVCFRESDPYDPLARAISNGEVAPWYQPVISAETGDILGVEILARWYPPSGAPISPDIFIPMAEKSGLIIPLSSRLMEQVARDLAKISERLRHPFHIAFNVSAAHLLAADQTADDFRRFQACFPDGIIQTIAEITEREPFEQSPQLESLLQELRRQGIQIALDDFGTGYSNLRYLNTLPIDYIKIDRFFTSQISSDDDSNRLVECVIDMAQTLGKGIVAEGVETQYQRRWLTEKGVPLLQGFYFSRALPAAEFIRLVVLQKYRFN